MSGLTHLGVVAIVVANFVYTPFARSISVVLNFASCCISVNDYYKAHLFGADQSLTYEDVVKSSIW